MEVAKVEGYIFVPDTTTLFLGYQLTIRLWYGQNKYLNLRQTSHMHRKYRNFLINRNSKLSGCNWHESKFDTIILSDKYLMVFYPIFERKCLKNSSLVAHLDAYIEKLQIWRNSSINYYSFLGIAWAFYHYRIYNCLYCVLQIRFPNQLSSLLQTPRFASKTAIPPANSPPQTASKSNFTHLTLLTFYIKLLNSVICIIFYYLHFNKSAPSMAEWP